MFPIAHSLSPDTDVKLIVLQGSKCGSWNIEDGGFSHPSNRWSEESGKLRREFDSEFRGQEDFGKEGWGMALPGIEVSEQRLGNRKCV